MAMRLHVSSKSQLSLITTGDFPPNSRVTGTKFCAAACMIFLPTAELPVNIRWSKGRWLNSTPTSTPPVTTATIRGSSSFAKTDASTSAVLGVTSEGLSIARLPAANTQANGESNVYKGAFHVPIMPTLPLA